MKEVPNEESKAPPADLGVKHQDVSVDGVRIFCREAGPRDAPVLLLPRGYPSSSFQYRHFMPALADRWRLIAPDFPGFGYSDNTPSAQPLSFMDATREPVESPAQSRNLVAVRW